MIDSIFRHATQVEMDALNVHPVFKHRNTYMKKSMQWISALALTVLVQACAVTPKEVWQKFTFDGRKDGWAGNTDLLEYAYGDKYSMVKESVTQPRGPIYQNGAGLAPQTGINGPMPVGEFLYVRWRVRATGQVFEERVDLRQRLPADMKDHGLTFVLDGPQLYVYVITPTPKGTSYGSPPLNKTWYSKSLVTYEIFPQFNKP